MLDTRSVRSTTGLEAVDFLTRRSEVAGQTNGFIALLLQRLAQRRRGPGHFLLCRVAFLASSVEIACEPFGLCAAVLPGARVLYQPSCRQLHAPARLAWLSTSLRAAVRSRARPTALPRSCSNASRSAAVARVTSSFAASRSLRAVSRSRVTLGPLAFYEGSPGAFQRPRQPAGAHGIGLRVAASWLGCKLDI